MPRAPSFKTTVERDFRIELDKNDFNKSVNQLIKSIDAINPKVVLPALRRGLKNGGEALLAETKRRVPVKTGRLRDSLHLVPGRKRRLGVVRFNVATGSRAELGISPDDKSFYPIALHQGHPKAAARPFMTEAAQLVEPHVFRQVYTELRKALRRAERKRDKLASLAGAV